MNGSPPSLDASAAPDLKGPAEAIEAHLRRFLQDRSLPPSLIEAMDYALMGGRASSVERSAIVRRKFFRLMETRTGWP